MKKASRHKSCENLYRDLLRKKERKYELRARLLANPPWSKSIRNSLLHENDIIFDNVKVSNDVMFSTKVGYYAKNISVDSPNIYCITVRDGSLITQVSEQNFDIRNEVFVRQ